MMTGADKNIILQAVSLLENVDEEYHARTLEALIHEYDVPDNHYELLDSIECDEFKKELEGSRTISGRRIIQEIPGRKVITHNNIITTDIAY